MIIGQPAPFVRAFVDVVDEAIRGSRTHWLRIMFRALSRSICVV